VPNAAEQVGRQAAFDWASKCESKYQIEAALALADDMRGISVSTVDGWDSDPWSLGTPIGVVDLRTGLRRDGRPEDQITKHAGVAYDPHASCPRWEQFISEVLSGDDELITFVRRALGYTLSGTVDEDAWFGCYGEGANGKSVLMQTLHQVMGDYSYVAPMSLVQRGSHQGRPDFQHAYLQHRRLVVASESSEGAVWDEEQLKKLSGRDVLHAEIKYGAEFNFWPTHKLWFMFNHQPRVRDQSKGFWRRVRLIPFQKFEGPRADKHLPAKLAAERPGILTWLVRACREWQQHGLPAPSAVREASSRYQQNEDPLGEFIQLHVRRGGAGCLLKQVYGRYTEWARDEGITHPLGRNRFGEQFASRGFSRTLKTNRPFFENCTLVFICTCMTTPCACPWSAVGTQP
jgi:putative DNA primase/helicase